VDELIAQKQYKAARPILEHQLVTAPNNVPVLLKLSQVMDGLGDLDGAIKRAREATEADPKSPQAHFLLGRYLDANRDELAAMVQYEVVFDLNAEDKLRKASYGPYLRLLIKNGRMKDAQKISKKWLRQDPNSADCHFNRAWLLSQLSDEKSQKEAIEEYRKCLELEPHKTAARYNLAILLEHNGDMHGAVTELKLFVEQAPGDPDAPQAKREIERLK
jgi:tetratricopeptide (TPR) repeat protein